MFSVQNFSELIVPCQFLRKSVLFDHKFSAAPISEHFLWLRVSSDQKLSNNFFAGDSTIRYLWQESMLAHGYRIFLAERAIHSLLTCNIRRCPLSKEHMNCWQPHFEMGLRRSGETMGMGTRKRNRIRFGCLAQFHAHKLEIERLFREGHRGVPIYEHLSKTSGLDMSYTQFMRYVRELCDREQVDASRAQAQPGKSTDVAAARQVPTKAEKRTNGFEHNATAKSVRELFNGE